MCQSGRFVQYAKYWFHFFRQKTWFLPKYFPIYKTFTYLKTSKKSFACNTVKLEHFPEHPYNAYATDTTFSINGKICL